MSTNEAITTPQAVGTAVTADAAPRAADSLRQEVSSSKPKSAAVNAIWNVFFTVWTSAISLILTPWLVRHLGLDYYGILLLIWSLTGVLGIMNLGLGEATLRYIAVYYSKNDMPAINRVVQSTLAIYLTASLAVSAVLVFAAPVVARSFQVADSDRPLLLTLIRMTAVVVTLGILTRTVGAVPAALQRYDVSSKINVGHSLIRFGGYILLLAAGLGIFHLVLWDALTLAVMLVVQVVVAKRLLPGLSLRPNLSREAGRELIGYSVFSFLTYVFHTTHREAAKLLTGGFLGPTGVSYVGVPDSLSQRVHGLVASAGETLLPRFSATGDSGQARALFWNSTWVATFVTAVIFVPYSVLLPDFLRLWIDDDFASRAAFAGQLVALSYVTQSIFVPAATLARGSGRPGIVTGVILVCGLTMLVSGLALIPSLGLVGVGISYVLASVPATAGTWYIARAFFKEPAHAPLFRAVGAPMLMGGAAYAVTAFFRSWSGDLGWVGFLATGAVSAMLTAVLALAAERTIGGDDSRTRLVLAQVARRLRLNRLVSGGSLS
jgi:O-antigen/teichoic acid export membrane protein